MNLITAALIALGSFTSTGASLPVCDYEDGRIDGQPCMWTDPDTGTDYFVDSRNYR